MRNSKPLISVLIPVYNLEGYVEQCIESILAQTYENLDIVVVDDGSNDKSLSICNSYAEKDNRVRVFHKENGGVVSARKYGADKTIGQYVITVDGDDWIEKTRIEHVVSAILDSSPDMVYMSGFYREYDSTTSVREPLPKLERKYDGVQISEELVPSILDSSEFFIPNIWLALWSWCIERDLYCKVQRNVHEKISLGDDVACLLECISVSKRIECINECGYHYVKRKTSLVASGGKNDNERTLSFWNETKEQLKSARNASAYIDVVMKYCFFILLETDYSLFMNNAYDHLIMYDKVKKGSKVTLYGAGNVGSKIAEFLINSDSFEIKHWVDKKKAGQSVLGMTIDSPDNISADDVDYVVIAVMYAKMAREIRDQLIIRGVPEHKIAMMGYNDVNETMLNNAFSVNGVVRE